ncbi:MAG: NAD-dependent epimerase/dehydratase family protein [Nanoarchaeota archaeon]
MSTKRILIIGGTGILGKAIIAEALKEKAAITVLGLARDDTISSKVTQIIVDRKDKSAFNRFANTINSEVSPWDIVVDVADFSKEDAQQTYTCFKNYTKQFFILSTVLVYDRSNKYLLPLKSSHKLAKKGALGGYVDRKLDIESFWHSIDDVDWTILRPYHILSPEDSLLGCIPDHNRDPRLIERIQRGELLTLCKGGEIELNFIDAHDIASIILRAAGNKKTFHKAYNAVNPAVIKAIHYYELIAQQLHIKLKIRSKSIQEIWQENAGWQLTTLPHVYDISDLRKDTGFMPRISIEASIKRAVKAYRPLNKSVAEIPVHQRMTLLPRPKPINWLLED